MRRTLAIFLLLQIGSNNAFAGELIKLPVLFDHYHHHSNEHNNGHGFIDFLYSHYLDHHGNSHEQVHKGDSNTNLPFKQSSDGCMSTYSPIPVVISGYLSADFIFETAASLNYKFENDRIESFDLTNIWQPPKIS